MILFKYDDVIKIILKFEIFFIVLNYYFYSVYVCQKWFN